MQNNNYQQQTAGSYVEPSTTFQQSQYIPPNQQYSNQQYSNQQFSNVTPNSNFPANNSPTANFQTPTSYTTTYVQQPAPFSVPLTQPNNTYAGTNMMIPAGTQMQQDTPLNKSTVAELELTKRLLENKRETNLKYADTESDKQKKLEDKADKVRGKAAQWNLKGVSFLVHMHEKKTEKLERKAHEHQMKSDDYKLIAKKLEEERKAYDPPEDKSKKVDAKKPGAKVDDKKKLGSPKPAVAPAGTRQQETPANNTTALANNNQEVQQPYTSTGNNVEVVDRPKRIVPEEKKDPNARYQQDVSTAALRYADQQQWSQQQQQPQQLQQVGTGGGRQ